jgi:hypothetical protein
MLANLDGYIERRAAEIAAERVQVAEDAASYREAEREAIADERLANCQDERQRAADLADELRKHLAIRDRQVIQLLKQLPAPDAETAMKTAAADEPCGYCCGKGCVECDPETEWK